MIIGLHGQKRVGKDTVYQIIRELYPKAVRMAIADKIKESLAALFDISVEEIESLKETGFFTVKGEGIEQTLPWRVIAQRYGTESHRDIFGQDFWLDAALPPNQAIDAYKRKLIVVTDVRFLNEAKRITHYGGYVIEVKRPELGNKDSHISEERLPSEWIDGSICNDGSLDDLREKVLRKIIEPFVWLSNEFLVE